MRGNISILKENFWLHTLYYSPLMAIRGSQLRVNVIIRTNTFMFWKLLIILYPLLLPSLFFVCLYAVYKKNFPLLMFFIPAVFCHLIYSYLLIYLPRYNHQFVSLSVICLMALVRLTQMLFTIGSNTLPVDWSVVLYS